MAAETVFDFSATAIDGSAADFSRWRGSVLLVFNTASECGFTPQLDGLQALWREHRERGLVVIGFPCDQFGGQEPGTNDGIAAFCERSHGVDFPLMAKVEVNGPLAHPLWRWLVRQAPGVLGTRAVKWNFTKFLVGRDGRTVTRFSPATKPQALRRAIDAALAA